MCETKKRPSRNVTFLERNVTFSHLGHPALYLTIIFLLLYKNKLHFVERCVKLQIVKMSRNYVRNENMSRKCHEMSQKCHEMSRKCHKMSRSDYLTFI